MREGQISADSALAAKPGKAFGFGRQDRLLEERPKPGSQTRGVLSAQNVIAHLAASWIRERGVRADDAIPDLHIAITQECCLRGISSAR